MKKLLFILFAFPAIASAGTVTFYGSPLATVVISTGGAQAQSISFDSSTVAAAGGSGTSPLTWNMTIGTGSNEFLVVGCATSSNNMITGVTVDGFNMTQSTASFDNSFNRTYIFTYVAPPQGSQAIAVTYNSGTNNRTLCGAVSFSGVSQSNPIDTSTASIHNPGSGTETVTWNTTRANDVLFDTINEAGTGVMSVGSAQAQQYQATNSPEGYTVGASTKAAPSSGSQTMTWTSLSSLSQMTAIAIAPFP